MNWLFRVAAALAAVGAIAGCSRSPEGSSLTAPGYAVRRLPFVEGAEPFRIALGDLNGDGRRDIVACGTTPERGFVRVFLAQPGGEYAFRDVENPLAPRGIALADLDDDGHLDLVTANNRANSISIFPGDGSGGFGERHDLRLLRNPFAVLTEDVDGDGRRDIVAVSEGGFIGIAYNRGGLAFDPWRYFQQPYGLANVIATGLDGDGHRELVVPNWRENHLAILENLGGRQIYPVQSIPYAGKAAFGVASGDFDRDGHADLAVTLLDQAKIELLFGKGNGSFRHGRNLAVGRGVRDVVAGRLNEDEQVDLVSTSTEAGEVRLFYGDGQGGFLTRDPLPAGTRPRSSAVGDLNGDGLDDIVVANLGSHDLTLFLSQADERIALAPVPPDPAELLRPLIALADVYARAEADFKADKMTAALGGFGRIVETGEKLFRAGALVPAATSAEWMRYLASVALVSDVRRYYLEDPAGARDVERRLARLAERRRYFNVAAVEWMAVADIERYDLGDVRAAAAAYERIARLARGRSLAAPRAAVYAPIADGVLFALDALRAAEPGQRRRLEALSLPLPFQPQNSDIASTIIPHLSAFGSDAKSAAAHAAFVRAHPRSFRAAYGDYFDFVTSVQLGPLFRTKLPDPARLHDAFLQNHPDDLLCFAVVSQALVVLKGNGNTEGYDREVALARTLGENFGVEVHLAGDGARAGAMTEGLRGGTFRPS